jgi:hypothetical protein
MKNVWIACGVLALSVPLAAQTGSLERTRDVNGQDSARLYQKMVGEVRARIAVEARITTGAPYSAEAVTEANQLLADGNRINRKTVSRVYRDGEGRTRREELDASGVVVSVSIVDPVAHVSYVLDPASRSAYRDPIQMAMPMAGGRGRGPGMMRRSLDGAPADMQERTKMTAEEAAKVKEVLPSPPPPPPPPPMPGFKMALDEAVSDSAAHEDLGRQNIEGVVANGLRSTTTIPAGDIGNLQPIKVVSEQWFSPDLQVLVMTRHTDPRSGETIYKLQNIVRAEPDRSLFTVPADYTLKESGIREPLMP